MYHLRSADEDTGRGVGPAGALGDRPAAGSRSCCGHSVWRLSLWEAHPDTAALSLFCPCFVRITGCRMFQPVACQDVSGLPGESADRCAECCRPRFPALMRPLPWRRGRFPGSGAGCASACAPDSAETFQGSSVALEQHSPCTASPVCCPGMPTLPHHLGILLPVELAPTFPRASWERPVTFQD